MTPSYVKAYLKRSKNDANDAAAICEAVTRPSPSPRCCKPAVGEADPMARPPPPPAPPTEFPK